MSSQIDMMKDQPKNFMYAYYLSLGLESRRIIKETSVESFMMNRITLECRNLLSIRYHKTNATYNTKLKKDFTIENPCTNTTRETPSLYPTQLISLWC